MSKPYYALVFLLLFSLLSFAGCEDDGCDDPSPDRQLDAAVLNAVPHFDGQRLTYLVSDGTQFSVAFRGGLRPPLEEFGCTEQLLLDFEGGNARHRLSGQFDASPDPPNLADIFVLLQVNGVPQNTLQIELFGSGQITAGNNATARVIPEFTREGATYRNVLEQVYPDASPGQVERAYYSTERGLLGIFLVGGVEMWQQ